MWIATIILSVLLAAAFLASFTRKVRRASSSMQLRNRLAVAPWLWQLIGLAELAGGLGLLVGLGLPALGLAAAVGAALLMIGAVIAHLRRGIGGRPLTPPLVLLGIAVAVTTLNLARL